MWETNRKQVVCLSNKDSLVHIDALVAAGMRVALLDGGAPAGELSRLRGAVQTVFQQRNTPIGLLLRTGPGQEAAALEAYQYILLEGFADADALSFIRKHATETSATWMVEEPQDLDAFKGCPLGGVCTANAALAAQGRAAGLLVLTTTALLAADALLWPMGTKPEQLENPLDAPGWDTDYIQQRYSAAQDLTTLTGIAAAQLAQRCGAKAILLLTADGENLAAVSSLYPPVPLIATAQRPEGEGMLLRQTLRWGTLPTAIGKVPESPLEAEGFARFVAELYGFEQGSRIVATGHWLAGQNPHNIYCFTL